MKTLTETLLTVIDYVAAPLAVVTLIAAVIVEYLWS
jgi:hypothetical protein